MEETKEPSRSKQALKRICDSDEHADIPNKETENTSFARGVVDKGAPFSPSKDGMGSDLPPASFTHVPSKNPSLPGMKLSSQIPCQQSTEPTSQEEDGSNTKPYRFFLKKVESRKSKVESRVAETSKKGKAWEKEREGNTNQDPSTHQAISRLGRPRKRSLNRQELS
ncbi:hypothetical protein C4D60_Mb02t16090 [Musa balbisiana]|uniref:Uncharacterized protein n=1 Tax=Musa balbisiana TaxID=52838 RepID=A0A4S8IB27_MUSBA|nr:hypothetical protein C4D60_Mb02t16090 [Musa balbisiana]